MKKCRKSNNNDNRKATCSESRLWQQFFLRDYKIFLNNVIIYKLHIQSHACMYIK